MTSASPGNRSVSARKFLQSAFADEHAVSLNRRRGPQGFFHKKWSFDSQPSLARYPFRQSPPVDLKQGVRGTADLASSQSHHAPAGSEDPFLRAESLARLGWKSRPGKIPKPEKQARRPPRCHPERSEGSRQFAFFHSGRGGTSPQQMQKDPSASPQDDSVGAAFRGGFPLTLTPFLRRPLALRVPPCRER